MTFRSVGSGGSAAGGTFLAVPVPAGVVSGDVVVVCIASKINDATITAPSGMVLKSEVGLNTQWTSRGRLNVFYKILTGTDVGTYDFTWTTAAAVAEGVALAFYNVKNIGDPFGGLSGNQSSSSGSSTTAATLTPTTATTDLIIAGATADTCTFTVTTGSPVERYDASQRMVVATEVSPNTLTALSRNINATLSGAGSTFTRWFFGALHPPVMDTNFSAVGVETLGVVDALAVNSTQWVEALGQQLPVQASVSTTWVEAFGLQSPVQLALTATWAEVLGGVSTAGGLENAARTGTLRIKHPDGTWKTPKPIAQS